MSLERIQALPRVGMNGAKRHGKVRGAYIDGECICSQVGIVAEEGVALELWPHEEQSRP